ncbi:MAG: G3E family GTPase [Kiritimatiellia bacterium]|jgi:G3E family GTPase
MGPAISSEHDVHDVPVTLITGFLGVGKTTAIRSLLAANQGGERWAVLVNEFGEVGIDGAVLQDGELVVREVPGGCICCSAGLALRVALVRLLREVRPHRLIIEPTGLAHPANVLDTLRQPGLRDVVSPRATITLVDPRHVSQERYREHETWTDQVVLADVLVANKCDLASAQDLSAFDEFAAALWPEKVHIARTEQAVLDPSWLDLDPRPQQGARYVPTPHEQHSHGATAEEPGRYAHAGADAHTCGWIFRQDYVFDRGLLEELLQQLVRPGLLLPGGVLRLKGVFRTRRAWLLVNADPDAIRWEALNYRRDSRVEIIVSPGDEPDWTAIEAALHATRWTPSR